MVHADAVRYRDCCEGTGRATHFLDAGDSVCRLICQIDIAGRCFVGRCYDAYHGLGDGFIVQAHAAHKGAVRGAVQSIRCNPGPQSPLIAAIFVVGHCSLPDMLLVDYYALMLIRKGIIKVGLFFFLKSPISISTIQTLYKPGIQAGKLQ